MEAVSTQVNRQKNLGSYEELQDEAGTFVHSLTVAREHATFVTLSGDLGAGKTSFVQGVAKALGITDSVTSPTFVLQKSYSLPQNPTSFTELIHIDAYRLEGEHTLTPLKFTESYQNPSSLIMLEWPERVADELPPADVHILLEVLPDNTRSITYTYA